MISPSEPWLCPSHPQHQIILKAIRPTSHLIPIQACYLRNGDLSASRRAIRGSLRSDAETVSESLVLPLAHHFIIVFRFLLEEVDFSILQLKESSFS